MKCLAACLVALVGLLATGQAAAASLQLTAKTLRAPGLEAQGLQADWTPGGRLQVKLKNLRLEGEQVRDLSLGCARLQLAEGQIACTGGRLSAPDASGEWSLAARHQRSAQLSFSLHAGAAQLDGEADADAQGWRLKGKSSGLSAARLLAFAQRQPRLASTLPAGLTAEGRFDTQIKAQGSRGERQAEIVLVLHGFTAGEASGRLATEKLDARLSARLHEPLNNFAGRGAPRTIDAQLQLQAGQLYVEPVFNDFASAPLKLDAQLKLDTAAARLVIEQLAAQQTGVLDASGKGALHWQPGFALDELDVKLARAQLPAFFERYVAPWLAGKPLEDARSSGSLAGSLQLRQGRPLRWQLAPQDLSLDSERLALGLRGLGGELAWAAAGEPPPADSQLHWSGARFAKLALPGAALSAQLAGQGLRLTRPLRQPVLDGALRIDRLVLSGLGSAAPGADVQAEIEPIDLAQLSEALAWPKFTGTLAGKLPGLRLDHHVIALDGALGVRVFDGDISIDGLRWVEPLARSQRLTANVQLRRIDLAQLTGAFSFGRIEGRLDGEVRGLKLLGFKPVAFDAKVYTSPQNPGRRRISQRAIDNISNLGGGPSGLLSRSALRFFDDFAYSQLGWSCVLANGLCRMDGIAPAPDGGYVLVKGSLIPRIDVVGHSRRVDWNAFYAQLLGLRELQKPTTSVGAPAPAP